MWRDSKGEQDSVCIYCHEKKTFKDEHVLPRAFAGQGENWTLQNLVCGDCNATFSSCERAWTSSPGVAESRIFFGPAGRKRKGRSYRIHPAEHVYLIQDDDPIAYEAEILDGLKPRLRPQFIWTGTELFAFASDIRDAERLKKSFDRFLQQCELTAFKHPNATRVSRFLIAKLGSAPGQRWPCIISYEWRDRPVPVWLDPFPVQTLREPFYCRASIDQDDRLRVRAENLERAVIFFQDIQNKNSCGGTSGTFSPPNYKVHIGSSPDYHKIHRAIAKTAFNLAVRLLGRDIMSDSAFDRCRIYCLTGKGDNAQHPLVGCISNAKLAYFPKQISKSDSTKHILMLTSNGQKLVFLIRLYGGPVMRVHLGAAPLNAFERFVSVDYTGSGMKEI